MTKQRGATGPLFCFVIRHSDSILLNICVHLCPSVANLPAMPNLLGIDIGTSGTKTLICDDEGTVLATAMAEHPIYSPKPGWSEQEPEDWWQATCQATKAVLKKAKLKPAD